MSKSRCLSHVSSMLPLVLLLALFLSGCANPFASDSAPAPDPYYDDFTDIPIPRAMEIDASETSVVYGQGGLKSGVQLFKGRVEVSSLTAVMGANMTSSGWGLRSALRSVNSVLVFEKSDRFCVLYIHDGWWNTEMRIFVTSKLAAGDVNFPAPAASPGVSDTSTPAYSGEKMSGVESYPPGGFSSGSSVKPLSN